MRAKLWLLAIPALLLLAGCPPEPLPPGVILTPGLVYGLGYVAGPAGGYVTRELPFDLLEPEDAPETNRPAIVMVHGGGFETGTRTDFELVSLAGELALAGYVCFLIDYRLQADQPPSPPPYDASAFETAAHAAFVDTKAAMRHVRANAAAYGIDPDRIALFGESAGAAAALAAGLTGPDRFSDDGEAFPIPEENHPATDATPAVIVDCWGSAEEVLDEIDPADPPVFIWHGMLDTELRTLFLVALNLALACEESGVPYEFYPLPAEGHGAWDAIAGGLTLADAILEFLADYMP